MRGKSKKFLALILSLVMVLGMLPMTAAAAPETGGMDESAQTTVERCVMPRRCGRKIRKTIFHRALLPGIPRGKKDTWRYFKRADDGCAPDDRR